MAPLTSQLAGCLRSRSGQEKGSPESIDPQTDHRSNAFIRPASGRVPPPRFFFKVVNRRQVWSLAVTDGALETPAVFASMPLVRWAANGRYLAHRIGLLRVDLAPSGAQEAAGELAWAKSRSPCSAISNSRDQRREPSLMRTATQTQGRSM